MARMECIARENYLLLTEKIGEIERQSGIDLKAVAAIRHAADALLFGDADGSVCLVEAELAVESLHSAGSISLSREKYMLQLLSSITQWQPAAAVS